MNTSIDWMVIGVRLAINIPILYFLVRQWHLRSQNGNIKLVRRMVTIWVIAFSALLNYNVLLRILSAKGLNASADPFDLLALLISLFLLAATIYGIIIFEIIANDDLNKKH